MSERMKHGDRLGVEGAEMEEARAIDATLEGAPDWTEDQQERALLVRAQKGDIGAVKELLTMHRDPLFAIAWGYLGHREEALDAVQEAVSKALANIKRYDPTRPLSAWLSRITRNVCLDRLRRLSYRRHDSIERRREDGAPDPRAASPSPEAEMLRGELRHKLREAIATLRPLEQEVIILRDVMEWPYAQIERYLDLGHGTVASLIHRGRARLRKELESYLAHGTSGDS